MKPRTKLQLEVTQLSKRLTPISKRKEQWAAAECLLHVGYATKTRVICMDCGEEFSTELVKRKRVICPHCDTKLIIEQTRKSTRDETNFFALAEVFGEYQVIRNFQIHGISGRGSKKRIYISEVLQHWVTEDWKGNIKREVMACLHTSNYHADFWSCGNLEIRDKNSPKYDVYPLMYHPDSEFKAEYLKYGINSDLKGLTFIEAITTVPQQPRAETLLKAKQYNVLGYMRTYSWHIHNYWPSLKICIRNKVYIKSPTMFFDYLELLQHFGKDLRSPKYLFPKDLKKAHDYWMKKKRQKQEMEAQERKRKRAIENQAEYIKEKGHFFGMTFSEGGITIKVLESVQEFVEEGDKLKHCVFTNEYFSRISSLILSARIDGKPIETIEVSLTKFEILQSRGQGNKATKYHDRIVNLVNANMHIIESRHKAAKKKEQKPRRKAIQFQQVA